MSQENVDTRNRAVVAHGAPHSGEGIGSQLAANAELAMRQEHGWEELIIRIGVDSDNHDARAAYERWGFEHHKHFESGGKPYEMLLLRPEADTSGDDPPSPAA